MIKNYFKIALRTLSKNKVFTGINILGLSVGISASLVIYLLVNYHFSFDKFEKDHDRIYRVVSDFEFSGESYHNSGVTDPMGAAVRKELTGLEDVVSFRTFNEDVKISVPTINVAKPAVFKKERNIVFADRDYFKLVNYKWVAGSAKTSLNKPYQTVLTESKAKFYFPKLSATQTIGKQIFMNDTVTLEITGIVQDLSENSDFTFNIFIAYSTLESTSLKPNNWNDWGNTNGVQQLFVKLAPDTKVNEVENQLSELFKKYHKPEPGFNGKTRHKLQPLSNVHFNADYGTYNLPPAHMPTLYGLLAIAVFLLLLGCINFVNLTTAHASQRAKEIGIRKTMGSTRSQLILQFFSETFLLTLAAAVVSIGLIPVLLRTFSGFIPAGLHFRLISQPQILIFLITLILIVTILSGFYPAIILSGYKPVLVLKNQAFSNSGTTRNAWLRKTLTVSQFVIAQVFIMGALLVSKQISHALSTDLGFKKEAILYMHTNFYDTVKYNKTLLMDKLKAIPEISMVSLSNMPPSSYSTWSGSMKYKDGKKEIETNVEQIYGDVNYLKLYGLNLLAGTNLEQSDTVKSFIINETYAQLLGFRQPQQAIGKRLEWSGKQIPITGVVSDFHQKSFHETIKPLVISSLENTYLCVNIALHPQNKNDKAWAIAIKKIEKAWKEVYPADDFEYQFFDADLAKFYESEQNISKLLAWATGLAIFISCLGLIGLVTFTTSQRTKEIGVRKVLGATVTQIVSLISKDFILLVFIAFLIATPLAGIGMYKWLQNFAYRTDLSWWIFLMSGVFMLIVAIVTLAFHTIKAAIANPVKSLRTE